jgi:hypothetical protein
MKKLLTASKDATVYQAFRNLNAGLDEILEIGKTVDVNSSTSNYSNSAARTFISFNLPTTASVSPTANYYLNLRLANASGVPRNQQVLVYQVSRSWDEGSGYLYQNVKNVQDGITWNQYGSLVQSLGFTGNGIQTTFSSSIYTFVEAISVSVGGTLYDSSQYRISGSNLVFAYPPSSSATIQFTGSVGVLWTIGGGNLLTGSTSASITLSEYPLQDLRIDVTNILRPIVSESLQNMFNGLVIQFPTIDELNITNEGNIKVFSTQTHTIHQPTLEISWDNQTFVTGSLSAIPSVNVKVVPENLRESYTKGDVAKVGLTVRDEYPLKSFDSTLRYKNKYYLPTSSYYSITDTQSNTVIVDFDDATKINCDVSGSYIVLDTTPLYKGRFYTLKFKVNSGDYSRIINTDVLFKIN